MLLALTSSKRLVCYTDDYSHCINVCTFIPINLFYLKSVFLIPRLCFLSNWLLLHQHAHINIFVSLCGVNYKAGLQMSANSAFSCISQNFGRIHNQLSPTNKLQKNYDIFKEITCCILSIWLFIFCNEDGMIGWWIMYFWYYTTT